MAFAGYVVEAAIRFSGNGLSFMTRLSAATERAAIAQGQLTGQLSRQEAQWLRNAAAIEANARAHARLKASIAGGVAFAGGALIYEGLKAAGEFQRSMASVAINLPLANQAAMRQMVMHVSSMTAQSATTIADELATVASSGIKDPRQIQTLFPLFAKAADVGFLSPKHLNPVDTIKQLSMFSHQFGVYSGQPLSDMVNSAMRLLSVQPEGLSAMVTQGRYFVGNALARGVPMDEIFRQYMLMGQTGFLRGKGGSGVQNIMDYLEGAESITNHMSKVRRAAFLDLNKRGGAAGIGTMFDANGNLKFIDEKGNLHLEKAEQYLATLSKYMDKGEFANDLVNAFGKTGAQFLLVATRPSVQEQFARNRAAFNATPNVDQQWATYMGTFIGQMSVLGTNLKNVLIGVFLPVLPAFTRVTKTLADGLGWISDALEAHPTAGKLIATFLMTLTAAAASAALSFTLSAMTIPHSLNAIANSTALFAGKMATEAGVISTEGAVVAGGLGRVGGAILGIATVLSNPLVQALIAVAGGFTYGAYVGATQHPHATAALVFGGNPNYGVGPYNDPAQFYQMQRNDDAQNYYKNTSVQDMIRAGRHDLHIHGNIYLTTDADTLDKLKRDIMRQMPSVKGHQGALRSSPRGKLGTLDYFLPGGAH